MKKQKVQRHIDTNFSLGMSAYVFDKGRIIKGEVVKIKIVFEPNRTEINYTLRSEDCDIGMFAEKHLVKSKKQAINQYLTSVDDKETIAMPYGGVSIPVKFHLHDEAHYLDDDGTIIDGNIDYICLILSNNKEEQEENYSLQNMSAVHEKKAFFENRKKAIKKFTKLLKKTPVNTFVQL